jgi:hypothetical protein
MAAAIAAMVAPSSVDATVTDPWGHRAVIWEAKISGVQSIPGTRTIGITEVSFSGHVTKKL